MLKKIPEIWLSLLGASIVLLDTMDTEIGATLDFVMKLDYNVEETFMLLLKQMERVEGTLGLDAENNNKCSIMWKLERP